MFSLRAFPSRAVFAFLACALISAPASTQEWAPREIWKAGDMTLTAIQDLSNEMNLSLFKGPASEQERAKYFTDGRARSGINVFLLRFGEKIALFDAGTGTLFLTPGLFPERLESLGVAPEDVDFVLLTHLHTDHIGGLLREGRRAFPRAKLLVSKPELDFWLNLAKRNPSHSNAALVRSVVDAYGADVLPPFAFGDSPLPGVKAIDAHGHTPGHTAFHLRAEGRDFFIVGDLVHALALQLALPDECAAYDMDPAQAIQSRRRILGEAGDNAEALVSGMHFPFGEIVGAVRKSGAGWRIERSLPR